MTRNGAIYARISLDRTGAGLGVERQVADCRVLAEQLGCSVVAVHSDNDLSAYSGKSRPGYDALLADVAGGRVDVVLAWHPDRLHRSPVELEQYIAACDPRGVPTHTVRAGLLDLSTANGRMVARITGAVARNESEQKSERLKGQRAQAQAAGRWLGGRRPFGYLDDGTTPHADEAEALRDASRRALAGDSLRAIARDWNADGLTTTTGASWNSSKLWAALVRPRNAGLVGHIARTDGKRVPRVIGDAAWPAIIEREQWEALVALLTDPARRTHAGVSRRLLGSFLYRCECGQRVTSGGQGARGQDRYACPTGHLRRGADPIDATVRATVAALLDREGLDLLPPAPDVAPQRERLAMLRMRSDELARQWATLGMTAAQFRAANDQLTAEIGELEAVVNRAAAGAALSGIVDSPAPGAAFLSSDVDRQRAVVDAVARVTISRARPGRGADGRYFDPESVIVEPAHPTAVERSDRQAVAG